MIQAATSGLKRHDADDGYNVKSAPQGERGNLEKPNGLMSLTGTAGRGKAALIAE